MLPDHKFQLTKAHGTLLHTSTLETIWWLDHIEDNLNWLVYASWSLSFPRFEDFNVFQANHINLS